MKTCKKIKRNTPYLDSQTGEWVKNCPACNEVKPVTDFKIVLKSPACCKPCWNKRQRSYYQNKPEGKRRKPLSEEQKAKRREYYRKRRQNPEIREKCLAKCAKWRENNKEKLSNKGYRKALYKKHYHTFIKGMAAYDARKRNASVIIPFKRIDIIRRDKYTCYLCSKKLSYKQVRLDHVHPLSRGGSHKAENVKVSCQPCNNKKYNKFLTEFKKKRGDYKRFISV